MTCFLVSFTGLNLNFSGLQSLQDKTEQNAFTLLLPDCYSHFLQIFTVLSHLPHIRLAHLLHACLVLLFLQSRIWHALRIPSLS